jgi:predicted aspartyl protease
MYVTRSAFIVGSCLLFTTACATFTPDQQAREAAVWEAARQCQSQFPSIQLDRVDHYGRLHYTYYSSADVEGFSACYRERIRAAFPATSGRVSQLSGASSPVSVPIDLKGSSAYLSVTVNGSQPASLLLDTGAWLTVFNPALVQRLGLAVPVTAPRMLLTAAGGKTLDMPLVHVNSIKIGTMVVETLDVGVHDTLPEEKEVDGVLGMDVLNHFKMTINRESKQLTLEARKP